MALVTCADCGRQVSTEAATCPGCGRPIARAAQPAKQQGAVGVLGGIVAVVGAVVMFVVLGGPRLICGSRTTTSTPIAVAPVTPPPRPVVQADPTPADMARARQQFEHDRDALKSAKPKTETQVNAALGRKPDQCIAAGLYEHCQWYYATKPPADGRDVIAVSYEDGGVAATIF